MQGKGFFDDVYSKVLTPTANASLDALGKSLSILSQAGIGCATRKGEQRLRGKGRVRTLPVKRTRKSTLQGASIILPGSNSY